MWAVCVCVCVFVCVCVCACLRMACQTGRWLYDMDVIVYLMS
jgi:hypothetical protein